MAVPVSGLIGGTLSGYLLHALSGAMGYAGWQWLFFMEGLPSIAVGLAAFVVLTDGIKKAKWLTAEERALLEAQIAADSAHKAKHSLREVFTTGRVCCSRRSTSA